MELDELKNIWKQELQEDAILNKHSEDQLKKIMDKTVSPVAALIGLSRKHLRGGILLFCVLITLQIQRFLEGRISSLFLLVIVLFSVSSVAIYFLQFQIFNIKRNEKNLKKTLENQMVRFKDFLKIYIFFSLIISPVLIYIIMDHFNFIKVEHNIPFTIFLTIFMNIDTYFRYKKTYWKWLKEIEMTLQELETE